MRVKVSGFPDTVSESVSTDTESGVEETASAYEDFFTKTAEEPLVPKEKDTGNTSACPAPPKISALIDRVTVSPLASVQRFSV